MSFLTQLENDLNQSLKAKDELAVLTLRQIKTALTNAEIAKGRQALEETDVIKILKSEVKKRKDAIELYKKGGRPELAEKEQAEIEIVAKYLPPEMDEEKIRAKIKEIIGQMGATGIADLGKVMGSTMAVFQGQADGSAVNRIVREELGKLQA
jgi:hypothetical protein